MLGGTNFSVYNTESKSIINNITTIDSNIPSIKISSYNTFKFAYLDQKLSEKELEINKEKFTNYLKSIKN